jgi:hypothetical protein
LQTAAIAQQQLTVCAHDRDAALHACTLASILLNVLHSCSLGQQASAVFVLLALADCERSAICGSAIPFACSGIVCMDQRCLHVYALLPVVGLPVTG